MRRLFLAALIALSAVGCRDPLDVSDLRPGGCRYAKNFQACKDLDGVVHYCKEWGLVDDYHLGKVERCVRWDPPYA